MIAETRRGGISFDTHFIGNSANFILQFAIPQMNAALAAPQGNAP